MSVNRIFFLHADPNIPDIDLKIDGMPFLDDFSFKTGANLGDITLSSGTLIQVFLPDGTTLVTDATLGSDLSNATIVLTNGSIFIYDDTMGSAIPGQSYIVFRHLSPDTPALDVLINASVVSPGLTFQNGTEAVALNPNTYSVQFNQENANITVLGPFDISLDAGFKYFIYVIDNIQNLDVFVEVARLTYITTTTNAPSTTLMPTTTDMVTTTIAPQTTFHISTTIVPTTSFPTTTEEPINDRVRETIKYWTLVLEGFC